MHDPVRHLLSEHADIRSQLRPLRAAVADLEANGDAGLDDARPMLAAVARMMANQLLVHARKEDDALFPALEAVLGRDSGPTPVMRDEHREIHAEAAKFRATLHQLNEVEHPAIVAGGEALRRLAAGGSAADLARTGAEILRLLDAHFEKEELVLFPMCGELLDARTLDEVGRRMDEIAAETVR